MTSLHFKFNTEESYLNIYVYVFSVAHILSINNWLHKFFDSLLRTKVIIFFEDYRLKGNFEEN